MIISNSVNVGATGSRDPRKANIQQQIKRLQAEQRRLQKKLAQSAAATSQTSTEIKGNATASASPAATATQPVAQTSKPAAVSNPNTTMRVISTPEDVNLPQNYRDGLKADLNTKMMAAQLDAPATISSSPDAMQAVMDLAAVSREIAASSQPSDDVDQNTDPKEIMKQLQLIDLQIMTLQMRLGDDGKSLLKTEMLSSEEESAEPASMIEAAAAAVEAAAAEMLSPPTVQEDGHLDGYA